MNKKRVFAIHGWGGSPTSDWFVWLKSELEKHGFDVIVPTMPETMHPRIKSWVDYLAKQIGQPDENTYLIGHSIGTQAILRYLETINQKVGGVILVAGWVHLTDETWDEEYTPEIAKEWLETPFDFAKIKQNCAKFTAIQSDNDPVVPFEDSEIFKEKLGAEIIIEHNAGHISGEDGFDKLPTALGALIELAK